MRCLSAFWKNTIDLDVGFAGIRDLCPPSLPPEPMSLSAVNSPAVPHHDWQQHGHHGNQGDAQVKIITSPQVISFASFCSLQAFYNSIVFAIQTGFFGGFIFTYYIFVSFPLIIKTHIHYCDCNFYVCLFFLYFTLSL